MNWSELTELLASYSQQEDPSEAYTKRLPFIVDSAEKYLCQKLDLVSDVSQSESLVMTANSPFVDVSAVTDAQVADGSAVFSTVPVVVHSMSARVGNRWIPLLVASLAWVQQVWPDETFFAPPGDGLAYYAMVNDRIARVSPVPDQAYPLRITASWRPAPMSAANPRTWLGDNFPNLLLTACMVEILLSQKDEQRAQVWAAKLAEQVSTTVVEDQVRRGLGPKFQPMRPALMANPLPPPQPGA